MEEIISAPTEVLPRNRLIYAAFGTFSGSWWEKWRFFNSLYILLYTPHSAASPAKPSKIPERFILLPLLPPNPQKRLGYADYRGGSSRVYLHLASTGCHRRAARLWRDRLFGNLGLTAHYNAGLTLKFKSNVSCAIRAQRLAVGISKYQCLPRAGCQIRMPLHTAAWLRGSKCSRYNTGCREFALSFPQMMFRENPLTFL